MTRWTDFAHDASAFRYDPAALTALWAQLHAGDAELLPADARVLAAWGLFHAGDFQAAFDAGLAAAAAGAPGGLTVANKAQAVYAHFVEISERSKLALFVEVASRATAQIAADPGNASAHYFLAYALSHYSHGISIANALAQGLGAKVKSALETAIALAPQHADAHLALGAFHAEVIDKVGSLLGRTQGASKDVGLALFKTALRLQPDSAQAMVDYANGLVMLDGERELALATRLYEAAAASTPLDALQRLNVVRARAELADER